MQKGLEVVDPPPLALAGAAVRGLAEMQRALGGGGVRALCWGWHGCVLAGMVDASVAPLLPIWATRLGAFAGAVLVPRLTVFVVAGVAAAVPK